MRENFEVKGFEPQPLTTGMTLEIYYNKIPSAIVNDSCRY